MGGPARKVDRHARCRFGVPWTEARGNGVFFLFLWGMMSIQCGVFFSSPLPATWKKPLKKGGATILKGFQCFPPEPGLTVELSHSSRDWQLVGERGGWRSQRSRMWLGRLFLQQWVGPPQTSPKKGTMQANHRRCRCGKRRKLKKRKIDFLWFEFGWDLCSSCQLCTLSRAGNKLIFC